MSTIEEKFKDRSSAGRLLASQISQQSNDEAMIVAIPHGGIPVATTVAEILQLPLQVCFTTRIALDDNPELSVGAISFVGDTYLDSALLSFLAASHEAVANALPTFRAKLDGISNNLRHWGVDSSIDGKNVLLIDDVIATGNSIFGALQFLKKFNPRSVSVASPVISRYASAALAEQGIDHTTVLIGKESEFKPRNHYADFAPVDGAKSIDLLRSLDRGRQATDIRTQFSANALHLSSSDDVVKTQ